MEKSKTYYKLLNMYKTGQFITGKINAIETIEFNGKNQDAAIIFWDGAKIFIPADEMGLIYDESQENNKEKDNVDKRRSILRGLLGAEVSCIITEMNNENEIVYASREKAMEMNKKISFDEIKVGDVVTANVVGTGRNSALLEIAGIQVKLPIQEIAWGRIYDIRDYIKVGDKKKVIILSKDDNKIEISLKQMTKEPYKEFIEEKQYFKPWGEYIGKIRQITPMGLFIELRPGITVMCNYPNWSGFAPKLEQEVVIRIKRLREEKRFIDGVIIRSL